MPGLKEILKIVNDGSLLNSWHVNAVSALEAFLSSIHALVQQQKLPLSPIAISYATSLSGKDESETLAQLLASCFSQVGVRVNLCLLEDENTLKSQLNGTEYAIVLCTPQYAAKVGKGSGLWNVLDNFGKTKKNALHPLLCEGGFADTALKIVDGHYLIRSFQAVLNKDTLVSFLALVEFIFHLSGSQGLGLLPDILNLKETVNAQAEVAYKSSFTQLQLTIQKQTIDYRLKAALEQRAQHHPMKSHVASSPFPVVKEVAGVAPIVEGFLQSEAKVGLLFCQNKADTALTSFALTEMFAKSTTPATPVLTQSATRVLSIDCAQYPGTTSWNCVKKALKALKLKSSDIEEMKKEPLIIVLNGYQDLGTYDNLWLKNALSTWTNVKLLVTCQADYFKERGYLRCFLADVSNRRVEDIAVYPIPTFASLEAQMAALSITVAPDTNQDTEHYPISDKRKAEYVEITRFLERLHQIWVAKDYLKSALHQNPKLFISYAWEEDKTDAGKKALARQQMYLSRIAQDFKTVGIPTWLDTEQMSGNIDEQMEKNIAESDGVLVIATPRYIERAQLATNVKKEWDAIASRLKLQSQVQPGFRLFPLEFLPVLIDPHENLEIVKILKNHFNHCNFRDIDDDYVSCMTHPDVGLIPRWLCDTPEKKEIYDSAYAKFQQELQLLVGKHLVVNQGQSDVLAFDMSNRLKGYIAPFGLYTEDAPMDTRFDLVRYFEDFLNKPECKTSIVLGRAGSGKSLFALSTFKTLLEPWKKYQNDGAAQQYRRPNTAGSNLQNNQPDNNERPRWLPIFIQLRNYAQHPENAIKDALKQQFRLTDTDIATLKQGLNHHQQILFILDGYDELGSDVRPNYTESLQDWPHAKLLITSRLEHFDKDHRPLEVLTLNANGKTLVNTAQEVHLSPFSANEIEQYIQQYEGGKESTTYQTLKDLPGMMVLLDNPFLLTLVLQALPQLLANRQQAQARNIVRADIYEAFTQTWFLQETEGRELKPEVCNSFSEELAFRLFTNKTISLSDTTEKKELWTFFNRSDNQAAQEASPIRFSGGEYSFIHKSVYEYFVAKRLWRAISASDGIHLWKIRSLTEERPIIDFLAEMLKSSDVRADHEARLFGMIESSKDKNFPAIAPSNAITVLNQARVSFSGKDFRDVCIPGADLSGALCDNANFQNADLSNVTFTGAWLHGTNFNRALMAGVEFGEHPSISRDGPIHSCCYSPDGRILAIGTIGRIRILLVDTQTHAIIRNLEGHTSGVGSVVFSVDGQHLASGSKDHTVKLWRVDTGDLIKTFEGHTGWVRSVALSTDRQFLASGSDDNTAKLWDIHTGGLLKTFEGHTGWVTSVVFSPNGEHLVSGSVDHSINLWHVGTSALIKTFEGHTDWVTGVVFSPNGERLASGSRDQTINLWDVNTGTLLKTLKGHTQPVWSVAFSPKGHCLASGSMDKTINLWDINTGALIKTLEGHTSLVTSIDFSPDGRSLASSSYDFSVRFWNVDTSIRLNTSRTFESHTATVTSVVFSPDGQSLASASADKTTKLRHAKTGVLIKTLEGHTRCVWGVAFNQNGRQLASGSDDNTAKLWHADTGSLIQTLEGHVHPVRSVTFSPDGLLLATASGDDSIYAAVLGNNDIKLWRADTGVLFNTLKGHTRAVYCIAFSPADEQCLASGSEDKTIRLWDVNTGLQTHTLAGHTSRVWCIAFSSDGQRLVSGSIDYTAMIWQIRTGSPCFKILKGHRAEITSVAFSPDGKCLATASIDCTLRLWRNLNETTAQSIITQVAASISSISFNAQSQRVFMASGHYDHSVRYWELVQVNRKPYFQLLWSTRQNSLLSQAANIFDARGLSLKNVRLLQQRGAIGKPLPLENAVVLAASSASTSSTSTESGFTPSINKIMTEVAQLKLFSDAGNAASGSSSSQQETQEKHDVVAQAQQQDQTQQTQTNKTISKAIFPK